MWKPSVSYNSSINDVKTLLTPSEQYRAYSRTTQGKQEKMIKRLLYVIKMNSSICFNSIIKLQSVIRGKISRKRFFLIKQDLISRRDYLRVKIYVNELVESKNYQLICKEIASLQHPSQEMIWLYAISSYHIQDYSISETLARKLIAKIPYDEKSYFLLASSLVAMHQFEKAYDVTSDILAELEIQNYDLLSLHALICYKLKLPKLSEALIYFDKLVQNDINDMNRLLHRALCLLALHDWDNAIEDLTTILYFQPKLSHILCLRARAYSCARKWSKAISDYKLALKYDSSNQDAISGLNEINQPYEELPMIKK